MAIVIFFILLFLFERIGKVKHQAAGREAILGIGEAQLERAQAQAAAKCKPGAMAASCLLELIGTARIEAHGEIGALSGQHIEAEHQMVEQFASKVDALAALRVPIARLPAGEVGQRERKPHGGMLESHSDAGHQIERQALGHSVLVEGLHLSAQVVHGHRYGEVALFVVIVQTQVHSHSHGIIAAIAGREELQVGTARHEVGKQIGITGVQHEIAGRERARYESLLIGFVDGTVIEKLGREGCCVSLAKGFNKLRSHEVAACRIGHEHQPQRLVAHVGIQGRILRSNGRSIVDEANVLASQRSNV